jgi:Tol biopolymer transport system component/DNA-binding SARP family transcriptional activator
MARMHTEMLQLRLLGGIDLTRADGTQVRAVLSQPKRLGLLIYLAAALPRGFHRRDTLLALFWPESPQHRARRALNRAVYYLRQSLGHGVLVSRGNEDLAVDAEWLWCDAVAFEQALDADRAEDGLELYRGDVAPGFHVNGLRDFEQWLESERGRLRSVARDAALLLADRDETRGEPAMAAHWAYHALTSAPHDELVIQRRMTLLDRAGDRAGALAAYDAFVARLREDLGVGPSPETQSLLAAVRTRHKVARDGGAADPVLAASPALEVETASRGPALPVAAPAAALGTVAALIVIAVGLVRMLASGPLTITTSNILHVTSDPGLEFQPAISPNGSEVAYIVGPIGTPRLVVRSTIDVGLGESRPAEEKGGNHWLPAWTPDGASLRFLACPSAFESGCDWKEVGKLGGPVRTVSRPSPGRYAWSRDGTRVAFAVRDSIFAFSTDNPEPQLLGVHVVDPWRPHSLAWSPDGRLIAYVNRNARWRIGANVADASIWILDADGGEPVRVTDDEHMNVSPQWLPDNRHLLFISNREGQREVYVVEVGPTGPRGEPQKVPGPIDPHSISIAADGRRLAYAKFTVAQNIWSMPIPPSGAVSIREAVPVTTGNQTIESHSLSPDGKWIAFDCDLRGEFDIFKQPLAGGQAQVVADVTGNAYAPDWSPDGTEIAFHSISEGTGCCDVLVVSADGGIPEQLTDFPGQDSDPDWSPDGLAIAYQSPGPQGVGTPKIWIVSRDSVGGPWGDPVQLQLTDSLCLVPMWAPDGASLVCYAGRGALARVSRDGEVYARRAKPAGMVGAYNPQFSPDGSRIYTVATEEDGSEGVWWIPANGGDATKVVAFDDPSLTVPGYLTVGPEHLYLTIAEYESDIWVMDLEY